MVLLANEDIAITSAVPFTPKPVLNVTDDTGINVAPTNSENQPIINSREDIEDMSFFGGFAPEFYATGEIIALHVDLRNGRLKNLTNSECLRAFGKTLVSTYSQVIVVTDGKRSTRNSTLYLDYRWDLRDHGQGQDSDFSWICGNWNSTLKQPCDLNAKLSAPDRWSIKYSQLRDIMPLSMINDKNHGGLTDAEANYATSTVKYCLVEEVDPACSIGLQSNLLWAVICCNMVKIGCFAVLIFMDFSPLVILGDAIASFLSYPDMTTAGLGPISIRDVYSRAGLKETSTNIFLRYPSRIRQWWRSSTLRSQPRSPWEPRRHRWASSSSRSRWATGALL